MHESRATLSSARYASLLKKKGQEARGKWWAAALVSSLLCSAVLLGFAVAHAADPDTIDGFSLWMMPKKKGKSKTGHGTPPHTGKWCHDTKDYLKDTLKPLLDTSISRFLPAHDLLERHMLDASSLLKVDRYFYVICDSSWSVLRLHETLPYVSELNELIHMAPTAFADGDSGFEAIFHDSSDGFFYLVRNSVYNGGSDRHFAVFAKVWLPPPVRHNKLNRVFQNYTVVETCRSQVEFESTSKGFEGATAVRGKDGVLYVLGLCEGNHCQGGDKRKEKGNGRIVVMQRKGAEGEHECQWETVRVLELPKSAAFTDYSAITLHHKTQALAISSRENSQVWVGRLTGGADGLFEPGKASFDGHGELYDFPRNLNCEPQYCNIEGLHWLTDGGHGTPQMLAAVSGKMNSKGEQGKQPFTCLDKDESLHLFGIP